MRWTDNRLRNGSRHTTSALLAHLGSMNAQVNDLGIHDLVEVIAAYSHTTQPAELRSDPPSAPSGLA